MRNRIKVRAQTQTRGMSNRSTTIVINIQRRPISKPIIKIFVVVPMSASTIASKLGTIHEKNSSSALHVVVMQIQRFCTKTKRTVVHLITRFEGQKQQNYNSTAVWWWRPEIGTPAENDSNGLDVFYINRLSISNKRDRDFSELQRENSEYVSPRNTIDEFLQYFFIVIARTIR